MAITILLGPAGAGKTEAALAELARPRRGRAILVLPGRLHTRRLADALRPIPRLTYGPLDRVARAVLRLVGERAEPATATVRLAVLRAELGALAAAGRLAALGPVATRSGVVAEALRLIEELRAAEVLPAALAAAEVSPYDADLAAVYAAYGVALDRLGLCDDHGLLLRARDALREGRAPGLRLDLLVADGFDQLSPAQLGLLGELAGRAAETLITLTGEPRARPAHSRYARTLAALRAALPGARVVYLPPSAALASHAAQIERGLFEAAPPPPVDAAGAVTIVSAPDREREVRAALRRVKALLAAGAAPATIGVLYRAGEPYLPLLREVAAEYGLPLALYEGLPLGEAPPIVALRELLALPRDGFPRRSVAEAWRNLGAGSAAALLERATAGAGSSLSRTRAALAALAAVLPSAGPATDEAGAQPPLDGPPATPAEAAALLAALDAFVAWLTPPEEATPGAYVAWLRSLSGWGGPGGDAFDYEGHEGDAAHKGRAEADLVGQAPLFLAVLRELVGGDAAQGSGVTDAENHAPSPGDLLPFMPEQRACLRQVLAEREAVGRLLGEGPRPYGVFLGELGAALDAARYGGRLPAAGVVAVLPFLAARGQAFDHVLLLGVGDGVVPARMPDPPFYTRRERAALAARGAAPPPVDPGDERALFYEAALRGRRTLTLAYTRLDEGGNPLRPSPYLRALAGLFHGVEELRIRAGSAPAPTETASAQEALVSAAAAGALDLPPPGAPAGLAAHVARAAGIERLREEGAGFGLYEGVAAHATVRAALSARFGPQYRWSVTQINDYTICPYRFLAAHLLRVGPRADDEGLEQAGRGLVAHAILARAGEAWASLDGPFDPSNEGPILAALAATADAVLAEAPQRLGFEPGPFWAWEQAEVRAALTRAVARSLRDGPAGFRPVGVEVGFGMGGGMPPLRVATPAGEALVVGRIDRVDRDDAGNLAVVDYKSGRSVRGLGETLSGRDVQLTVYSLAAEGLVGAERQVVRAAYLTLGNGRQSRPLTPDQRPQAEESLRGSLVAAIRGAREGDFAVRPSDGCPRGCAFASICRVNPVKVAAEGRSSA